MHPPHFVVDCTLSPQGPGGQGGRPPLNPIAPGFGGLGDDPSTAPSTPPSPDKGHEASAVLAGSISKGAGLTRVVVGAPLHGPHRRNDDALLGEQGGAQDADPTPQNRLPVAEDISGGETRQKVKVVVEAPDSLVTVNKQAADQEVRTHRECNSHPKHKDPGEVTEFYSK